MPMPPTCKFVSRETKYLLEHLYQNAQVFYTTFSSRAAELQVLRPNRVTLFSALLAAWVLPVTCLVYFSILKMEAISISETSVDFYWTTRGYGTSNPTTCNSSARQRTEPHVVSEGTYLIASTTFILYSAQTETRTITADAATCCEACLPLLARWERAFWVNDTWRGGG
jgi:hypothetical protein